MTIPLTDPVARASAYLDKVIQDMKDAEHFWLNDPTGAFCAKVFFAAARMAIDDDKLDVPHPDLTQEMVKDFQIAIKWMSPQNRHALAMFTQVVQSRVLWSRTKILHPIDGALWGELKDIARDVKLPAELFTKLPYPDPFVYFPEPIIIPLDEPGQFQRIEGVFIHGRRATNALFPDGRGIDVGSMHCSTASPMAVGLGLSFAGYVEYADGSPLMVRTFQDVCWTHTSLIPSDGGTLGAMIEGAVKRFSRAKVDGYGVSSAAVSVPELCTQAVSALVYLCCKNADLTQLPPRQGRSRRGSKSSAPKPPKVIKVGYRVGAELKAYHRRIRNGESSPTGQKMAPHVRRSHPHTFRCGPGRKDFVMYWMHPIMVNMNLGASVTTVSKVKSSKRAKR
jgi:hypothetical protein